MLGIQSHWVDSQRWGCGGVQGHEEKEKRTKSMRSSIGVNNKINELVRSQRVT